MVNPVLVVYYVSGQPVVKHAELDTCSCRPWTNLVSGGSWWNWPGGLRDFISGWTCGIVALAVFISGVSSHSSSPNLIKIV